MEEDLDLLLTQFPVLSHTLEEDFPLYQCVCPHCDQPFWALPAPEYFFTCGCGGISVFEGLMLKIPTPADYKAIRNIKRMKTVGYA